VYQTCLPGTREEKFRTSDQATRSRLSPATSNCSITKAVQPRKDLAFPSNFSYRPICMPLEGSAQRHLRAAHGYIDLEMFEEANAELEEIDPFCRHCLRCCSPVSPFITA
jgi:hypothetical protein